MSNQKQCSSPVQDKFFSCSQYYDWFIFLCFNSWGFHCYSSYPGAQNTDLLDSIGGFGWRVFSVWRGGSKEAEYHFKGCGSCAKWAGFGLLTFNRIIIPLTSVCVCMFAYTPFTVRFMPNMPATVTQRRFIFCRQFLHIPGLVCHSEEWKQIETVVIDRNHNSEDGLYI